VGWAEVGTPKILAYKSTDLWEVLKRQITLIISFSFGFPLIFESGLAFLLCPQTKCPSWKIHSVEPEVYPRIQTARPILDI
jgi:hypothetical protein